ncbi:MAG: VCBS repeat-containing protein [Verrucomicrobiae bacterium]|nr:VCBS repeat-containing protein [Verrucomicrobiae bacterium]
MPPFVRPCFLAMGLYALIAQGGEAPQLDWIEGDGYRRLPLKPSTQGTGFTRLAPADLGITWTNYCSPARYSRRQNLMNGSGVALGDFDGDGWCDIYFCNLEGPNALYRNLGGWRFTNVTEQAGVAARHLLSTGALFADFNGNGLLDLHVTSFLGPDALFLNQGDGTFTNVIDQAGISIPGAATSSAAADLNGDGWLDLYVARFAVEAFLRDGAAIATRMVGGQPVVTGRPGRRLQILNNKLYESGEPDLIFLNQGGARFVPISWPDHFTDEQGKPFPAAPPDLGFTVQLRDINGDGFPDIFVCNDFQTPDRIWINDGKGRFREAPSLAIRNMSYASMGVDVADIDRDGFLDFYTVEMLPVDHFRHMTHVVRGADPDWRRPRDPFYRDEFSRSIMALNRGDGTYAEIGWYSATATSDWSWTPIFLDVDLDGYEDLIISSGYPHDVNDLDVAGGAGRGEGRRFNDSFVDQLLRYPPLDSPHLAWRNRGDRTFEDVSREWGFDFRVVTHGMALADLDNDGDLDVVGNSFNHAPLICRNEATGPRIAVRLVGQPPNTHGTGARIRVLGGPVPVQEQEMLTGGRYLSSDQHQRTFATGTNTSGLSIEVRWRDGTFSRVSRALPDNLYEIHQSGARPGPSPATPSETPSPHFVPVAVPPEMLHHDPDFDEFTRQPLLPWRQSFQGPGVLWLDGSHQDDDRVLIGNGRGGIPRSALVRPTPTGPEMGPDPIAWGTESPDDTLGLLAASFVEGTTTVLLATANYESASPGHPAVLRFDRTASGWSPGPALPGGSSSPGPMAVGDIDGDGDLDLVVAGRMVAGRYPEAADTRVFRNEGGRLEELAEAGRALAGIGLVTGALFADLTGDGTQELVLACEWGPLRVFRWSDGQPREITSNLGLDRVRGVWQGIAAADFDGDGRIDLVAGNWGRNSYQQRAPGGPWQLHFADLEGDGRVAIVESYWHPGERDQLPFRTRDTLATQLRWLPAAFPRHADFARANVSRLLGEHAPRFASVEATTLASVVLLNRGSHFDLIELPPEAQWTPIFGFAVADFDGDGNEDLFCVQNFFGPRDEDDRQDAGRGLLLVNDGTGRFAPVSGAHSGLRIHGEQRGAAVADLDADGRPDLLVTQNSGPLTAWLNRTGQPGLRVRLQGTAANPDAAGAQLRLLRDDGPGPLREVRLGSGRYSQDSRIQILGGVTPGTRLWWRFPGGAPQNAPIPDRAREIELSDKAGLRLVR